MFNKKLLSSIDLGKYKKKNPYKKDIILDPMGQWKHPGKNTRIPSSSITMKGVNYPVLGVSNTGQKQMMQPGQEYNFPGAEYVDEYPQMKKGGSSEQKIIFSPMEGGCPDGQYWTGSECKPIPPGTKIVYSQEELDKLNISKKEQQKLYNDYLLREKNHATINAALRKKYGPQQSKPQFYKTFNSIPRSGFSPMMSIGSSSLIPNGLGPGIPSMKETMMVFKNYKKLLDQLTIKPIGYKGHPGSGHFYPVYEKPSNYILGYNREEKELEEEPIELPIIDPPLLENKDLGELQVHDYSLPDSIEAPQYTLDPYTDDRLRLSVTPGKSRRVTKSGRLSGGQRYKHTEYKPTKDLEFGKKEVTKPIAALVQKLTGYDPKYFEGYEDEEGNFVPGELDYGNVTGSEMEFRGAASLRDYMNQQKYKKEYADYDKKLDTWLEQYEQSKKKQEQGQAFKKGGTKKKYTSDIINSTNYLFAEHPLFKKKKQSKKRIYDPKAKYYADGGENLQEECPPYHYWNGETCVPVNRELAPLDPQYLLENPDVATNMQIEPEVSVSPLGSDFSKALSWINKWHDSPMHDKMLMKSIKLETPRDSDAEEKKLFKEIKDLRKKNIQTIPALDIDFDKTNPNVKLIEDLYGFSPWGISDSNTGNVSVHQSFPGNKQMLVHETSHSSDRPAGNRGRLIPYGDQLTIKYRAPLNWKNSQYGKNEMAKFKNSQSKLEDEYMGEEEIPRDIYEQNQFDDWNKYLLSGQGSEVRARLNEIRHGAQEQNIYDPFNRKITGRQFKQLDKKLLYSKPLDELRKTYSDKDIKWMLNNISKNDNETDDTIQYGKTGGQLSKAKYYQFGGLTRFINRAGKTLKLPPAILNESNILPTISNLKPASSISKDLKIGQGVKGILADERYIAGREDGLPIIEYNFPSASIRQLGDYKYQPYSEGWWAEHDMKTALEQPQWAPGKEDFFTDQEIVDLVNQQKDYDESLAAFDEMYPEPPGMEIMRALSGDTSRDELFANLFPNASIPNFRSKILSPEQTAALNRIELQNRSFQNKPGLSKPALKTLGVGQDILPKQYKDLLTFYKGSNWLKTAPAKDVVMEMRGLPELKGVDIKNASPLQLETWRDKIVKKMEKQAIERWKKDRGDKLTGLDAYNKMLNQSGSRNKYGGEPIRFQSGGEQEAMNAMMKARLAYANMFGNPAAQRMINIPDQPYEFEDGNTGTHYMASMDNYAVPQIQNENGKLMLGNYGPESREAIRFDSDEDANYFAENYKDVSPGFINLELTDDQIEEYRKGGYIVEDISVPSLTRMQPGGLIETAAQLLKQATPGNKVRSLIYSGIDPAGYGLRKKLLNFPKELSLTKAANETRPFRVGMSLQNPQNLSKFLLRNNMANSDWDALSDFEKMQLLGKKTTEQLTDKGKRRLDAWAVGLKQPQEYSTLEQVGDNTFRMKDISYDPEYFSELYTDILAKNMLDKSGVYLGENPLVTIAKQHYDRTMHPHLRGLLGVADQTQLGKDAIAKLSKMTRSQIDKALGYPTKNIEPWKQDRIVELSKINQDPMFKYSIYDNDHFGVMGGFRWDLADTPEGMLWQGNDTWDLNPWQQRGETRLDTDPFVKKLLDQHYRKPLQHLELLSLVGGKPFDIQNNFLINPGTFKTIKQYQDGGLTKLIKSLSKTIQANKKSGLLSNAYKVNPFAFKPNPEVYYRGIGKSGLDDALESGVFRQRGFDNKNYNNYKDVWYATGDLGFAKARDFAKDYIAEVPRSAFPETGDEFFGSALMPTRGTKKHIPITEGRILQKDWLKGYKEVPVELPGSPNARTFISEIDWSKWNPETPNYPELITEYNGIEELTKKTGTWMKNPDGSPYQGTPEQFIQEQSSHFRKAYPEGYNEVFRGVTDLNSFKDFTLSKNPTLIGDKAIFTADKNLATSYAFNSGNVKPILNPFISDNTGGVYDLIYPKGKQITYNTGASDWLDINLSKNATKENLQFQIDNAKKHYERLKNLAKDANMREDVEKDILDGQKQIIENLQSLYDNFDNVIHDKEAFAEMRKVLGDVTSTDAIAEYLPKTDLRSVTLQNIMDGGLGDVTIVNNRPGNYLKSRVGNVGFFNMNNPNIYKGLVPLAVGAGAGALMTNPYQDQSPIGEYKNGGQYGLGDEVDEATMKQLKKLGFTFEKIK